MKNKCKLKESLKTGLMLMIEGDISTHLRNIFGNLDLSRSNYEQLFCT